MHTLFLTTLLSFAGAPEAPAVSSPALAPSVTWTAPGNHVPGQSFRVELNVQAAKGEAIPGAWFEPAGFTVNGTPLGAVGEDFLARADMDLTLGFDLGPLLTAEADFQLGLVGSETTLAVGVHVPVGEGLDFMALPDEQLGQYGVLLRTNRGDMLVEFWPETAPNHARNFLDLSYTGFYDGVLFHRCIPGFVIQGGDPTTKDPATDPRKFGTGNGPRKLDAEFSDRPHERGVLSAARLGNDVNSATSQFFICHARVPSLDKNYTAFGQLRFGHEVMDAIVTAPKAVDEIPNMPGRTRPTERPEDPQVIQSALVVKLAQ